MLVAREEGGKRPVADDHLSQPSFVDDKDARRMRNEAPSGSRRHRVEFTREPVGQTRDRCPMCICVCCRPGIALQTIGSGQGCWEVFGCSMMIRGSYDMLAPRHVVVKN